MERPNEEMKETNIVETENDQQEMKVLEKHSRNRK